MNPVRLLSLVLLLNLVLVSSAAAQLPYLEKLKGLIPQPKLGYVHPGETPFRVHQDIRIHVASDTGSRNLAMTAMAPLQAVLIEQAGLQANLMLADHETYERRTPAIIMGVLDKGWLRLFCDSITVGTEALAKDEGFLLDITDSLILLVGEDAQGLMHAVARLQQLHLGGGQYPPVRLIDHPTYPLRWNFSMHNLRGANAVAILRKIADTMFAYNFNGLQQNDFKYTLLDQQPDWYFKNADTIIRDYRNRGIAMVPGVAPIGYSEGLLWHDPNLAEGIPSTATYVIEGDTGRMLRDPRVTIPNGGFESVNGTTFTGWGFYDNENNATQPDETIKRSGQRSARTIDPAKANSAGNARFNRLIETDSFTYYRMSAWVRTESLDRGTVQLLAIGINGDKSRVLTYTNFADLPRTTDKSKNNGWVRLETLFNSLNHTKMYVYCGIWGGNTGTIWWDDFTVEEAGLVNVLRRPGAPLHVYNRSMGNMPLNEGGDFAPIRDTIMEQRTGFYGYHTPVSLRRVANGLMRNGDTVDVRYYHPMTIYNDVNGYGSVMVCLSESKTLELLKDDIVRVNDLHHPRTWLMSHDEIRVMNWDSACLSRNVSPAQILGENAATVRRMIDTVSPGSSVAVWSDMFDKYHNAYNNYYLVNGDLTGSWDYLPKDVIIGNWNSGKMKESLSFFSDLGLRQFASPYYDQRSTDNIRAWAKAIEEVPNTLGMMYTTWANDYDFLRPFSYYAWGREPGIIHTPIDSITWRSKPVYVEAFVLTDPYDLTDTVESVWFHSYGAGVDYSRPLKTIGAGRYADTIFLAEGPYFIEARRGQTSVTTPEYPTYSPRLAVGPTIVSPNSLRVLPNPAVDKITLSGVSVESISILNLLGESVYMNSAYDHSPIDVSELPPGSYQVVTSGNGQRAISKFIIQR